MSDFVRPDIPVLADPPLGRPRLKRLRLAFILFGLSLLALVSTAFGMMMAVASDLPQLENQTAFKRSQNSVLVDVRGQYLATLSDQGRIIVPANDIALNMQHAIIAIEDERFYQNDGVDLRGIGRALVQDLTSRSAAQGGSTITQQFVKNATQAQSRRTVLEKIREAALAYHLTRKWSKRKILTEYLNSIYFGNGAYGIESAARTYFGATPEHFGCGRPENRCASQLLPHEAALLAGMVASPSAFDPVVNRAAAKRRRNVVLGKMLDQGYLTRSEYENSIRAQIPANDAIHPPQAQAASKSAAYFATWVRQQVVDRFGPRTALLGGLRVQTTIDLGMQRRAEDAIAKWLGNPPSGPNAALVAINNTTGEVRAMVGGSDYDRTPFNLATQGQRQPGSAFKPFVLATALRQGISPGSTWVSKKQVIQVPHSSEKFTVNNYDSNYSGVSTLARATTFSDNSVYAQVGIKAGTRRIARTAERMGIRTPVSTNYAITLGGLKHGVTPLDMAHAYQTFATGGLLVTGTLGAGKRGPVGVRKVTLRDHRDRVLRRNRQIRRRVITKEVANTTTSILESVIKVGTAKVASLGKVRAWGKTGTTENYGDAWFVGATDKYTVAVWVGYPNGLRPMRTEYRGEPVAGGTYPAQIWHDFMMSVLQGEQERVTRQCDREALKRKPDEPPSKKCVEAGLAADPNAPQPDAATDAPSTTTPADGAAAGDGPATGTGDAPAKDGAGTTDGATGTPAPQAPATPPAPVAPPTPATPPPVAPGAPVAPSGGVTPQP
ncbi:MAG: penicillin-binding protein [Solirubrobacteraceae bacterium]|jgi:penicillin-binding protein 1A|nr:penicillin-binding protein [Solirubrobacteraceae bacterium]